MSWQLIRVDEHGVINFSMHLDGYIAQNAPQLISHPPVPQHASNLQAIQNTPGLQSPVPVMSTTEEIKDGPAKRKRRRKNLSNNLRKRRRRQERREAKMMNNGGKSTDRAQIEQLEANEMRAVVKNLATYSSHETEVKVQVKVDDQDQDQNDKVKKLVETKIKEEGISVEANIENLFAYPSYDVEVKFEEPTPLTNLCDWEEVPDYILPQY